MSKSKPFDIYQYIPFRLVQTQLKMHASIRPEKTERAAALANLSQTEFRILILLASKGPMAPSVIADEYGFDRAVVTRSLSTLVKKLLLTNERDKDNQRSKVATLTALGEQYADIEFSVLRKYGTHLDAALDEGEKDTLFKLLEKLLDANNVYK